MDFKYPDTWQKDIFPLLENVSSGKSIGVDWTDFVWGSACFRQDYVMFLDKQIHQIGRKFPPVLDNNGYPIVDERGQWLENPRSRPRSRTNPFVWFILLKDNLYFYKNILNE